MKKSALQEYLAVNCSVNFKLKAIVVIVLVELEIIFIIILICN